MERDVIPRQRRGAVLYPLAVALMVWAIGALVVGPWLVAQVYADPSFPIGGGIISGSAAHPLDYYLREWTRLSWYTLPFVVLWSFIGFHGQRHQWLLVVGMLIVAAEVRGTGLLSRSIWDDEGITLLQTSGHNVPQWPLGPGPAAAAQPLFRGVTSCGSLIAMMRETDVHPALYFCALAQWKKWFGDSLEMARTLSLVCSLLSVLVFYLLLSVGGFRWPIIPATVYAMAPTATFWGSEARPYAFAELLLLGAALCAYLAGRVVPRGWRATAAAVTAGSCAGLALHANHLAAFPVAAVLTWFIVTTWSDRRMLGVTAVVVAGSISLIAVAMLLPQLDARPEQATGFLGVGTELQYLFSLIVQVVFYPYFPRTGLLQPYAIAGAALTITSLTYLAIRWRHENQSLWTMLVSLALAPAVGLTLLNVVFQKHLHDIQYVHYSASGVAALLAYPIVGLLSSRRALGLAALAVVAAVQALGVNWGFSEGPFTVSPSREQAAAIRAAFSPGQLVLIDAGLGRSNPASLVYELDPRTDMLVFGGHHRLDTLWDTVVHYEDLWIRFSVERTDFANQVVTRLEHSGCYSEVSYTWLFLRLHRERVCEPARTWPSRHKMNRDFEALKY